MTVWRWATCCLTVTVLIASSGVVSGCKKKRKAVAVETPTDSEEEETPTAAPVARRTPPPPNVARAQDPVSYQMRVTVNGVSPREGMRCTVSVFDEGSRRDPRASGPCGSTLKVPPGIADAVVEVRADAEVQRRERNAVNFAAPQQNDSVDVPWDIGRARVVLNGASDCQTSINGPSGTRSLDARFVYLPVGRYTGKVTCGSGASAYSLDLSAFEVSRGQDQELKLEVRAPVPAVAPVKR